MLKNAELIMHTGSAAVDSMAMNTAAVSSYKQELCARIQSCKFDVPSLQITAGCQRTFQILPMHL
jgi:hypothetical protein